MKFELFDENKSVDKKTLEFKTEINHEGMVVHLVRIKGKKKWSIYCGINKFLLVDTGWPATTNADGVNHINMDCLEMQE